MTFVQAIFIIIYFYDGIVQAVLVLMLMGIGIVVSIVRYAICIVRYVSYRRIVSAHESYDTVCVSYELYRNVKSYVLYDT